MTPHSIQSTRTARRSRWLTYFMFLFLPIFYMIVLCRQIHSLYKEGLHNKVSIVLQSVLWSELFVAPMSGLRLLRPLR